MVDDPRKSDVELVAMVAAHDYELAQQIKARLRRLRLERVVTPWPPIEHILGQADPHPSQPR